MGNCNSASQIAAMAAETAALKARIAVQDRKLIEQEKQLDGQIKKNCAQGAQLLEMKLRDEQMKMMLMAITIPILDAAARRESE